MEGRRVRFSLLISVSIIFLMAHNARSQSSTSAEKSAAGKSTVPPKSAMKKLSPAATAWVETTLRRMTVDEKIGQLLFATYHGSLTATDTAAYQQIMHDVNDLHVGGFINITHGSPLGVVKSQAYPTAVLNNQLQAKSKLPLLVGSDFERGTAMRLDEGTSFPTAMALAAGGDPKDAYAMGKITALEARAVGVHWIYAPDADVNNNPGYPIINTRSFGENPERVAQFVSEFVRGVRENGGLATAKHFPGHGDTAADSHIDLPVIRADRARLDSLELIPFRAAISSQVDSVMTGHLNVPALEPDPNTPATLSHNILTDLLRKQLGYQGLIVTDAMDMGGITVRYAPGEAAVRAIAAGVDCLLMPPVPDAAFEALQAAVKSGRISKERLDASVQRILQAKARLGLNANRLVDVNAVNKKFGSAAWQKEAQDISDRGVTLFRDTPHRLPLDGTKPSRALLLAFYADPEPYPGEDLERELRSRFDSVTTLRADTRFVNASILKLPPPDSYDVAILALFVRVSDRKGNVDVPAEQAALAEQIYKTGKPVITLGFGSPYLIERFPQAETWLGAFGISDVAQISAATVASTMYDIASLTKVVATTTLVAKLAEGDFAVPLDLDAKIERYLPEWAGGPNAEWRHRVIVRHLLTHTSGLPPFKEYWRTSKNKQDTLTKIFAEPLDYEPGTKEIYSDLGIILMAEIIERLTGRTLDDLAKNYIFSPLGMNNTMYRPPKKLWPQIAPTEIDNNLRHRLVQGEVHDENAFAIGGVSGHAGVFSTAPDLAAFCEMLMNGGVYTHQRILRRATIAQFTTPQQLSGGTRTLGWAVPTEGGSSGHYFSAHSFGHTGFTGTSIWIDPDRQLFVVLLTNRVHPTRENIKIQQVRPTLHDAVVQALGLATVAAPAK